MKEPLEVTHMADAQPLMGRTISHYRIMEKLGGELGESLATVQKFDVPLADATTSSLEALKAYSLGEKVYRERGSAAAL